MRIALLESDTHDAQVWATWLGVAAHVTRIFSTERELIRDMGSGREPFELVIAASIGPALTAVIEVLRAQCKTLLPIIGVLKKNIEEDIVAVLNAGADDCLIKPVRQRELLARIAAVTRRTQPVAAAAQAHFEVGALSIDAKNRVISRHGERLMLTPKTYDLAMILLSNTGQLLSRVNLMERVWGRGRSINTRTLDTHVSRIRAMLGLTPENGWKLQSVYQHGYRLDRIEAASPMAMVSAATASAAVITAPAHGGACFAS